MEAERQWLRWVRARAAAGRTRPALRLGIGDDAALLRPRAGEDFAITTDLMVEDVHFLRTRDTAASCGWRLATRALSDLAAMAAEPLCLFVSTAFPADIPTAWARGLIRGLLAAAGEAGAQLAGGDVAASAHAKIVLDVVGVGRVPRAEALRRSGAAAGDLIYVSGMLGLAARGRALVHRGAPPRSAEDRRAAARHRRPMARWRLGIALRGIATAGLDLSDGLEVDLQHLCHECGLGAVLEADRIPRLQRHDGLELALYGGEDYELLFTVPPQRRARMAALARRHDVSQIGVLRAEGGITLRRDGRLRNLQTRGWQHFALPSHPPRS